MKKLTLKDFEITEFMGLQFYLYDDGTYEVMLEPCFNGFDIAIYNKNKDLIIPEKICLGKYIKREKGCNSIKNWQQMNKLQLAIEIANEAYHEFKRTHGG